MVRKSARQGPKRVWTGYKNLRVPIELFDDTKEYLETLKVNFLEGEGIEHVDVNERLSIIEKKIDILLRKENPEKLPAKEKIRRFLMENPGSDWTSNQLAQYVDVAEGTARRACQELAEDDRDIHKFEGRPNRYYYYQRQS